MGASTSCKVRRDTRSSLPVQRSDSEDSLYALPDAMDNIMGIEVDRKSPRYQHALKLTTQLIIHYRDILHPSLKMSLDSFAETRYLQFREICGEVYNDLVFEEKDVPNEKFEDEIDMKVKFSIDDLAKHYTTMSLNYNQAMTMHFEDYYDDALRLIITDIERKQFWRNEEHKALNLLA